MAFMLEGKEACQTAMVENMLDYNLRWVQLRLCNIWALSYLPIFDKMIFRYFFSTTQHTNEVDCFACKY